MNFSKMCSELIINYNWLIYTIIGTLYTYFVWVSPEWNKLRVGRKLISNVGVNDNIVGFIKSVHRFKYAWINICLILFCMFISGGITFMFWYAFEGKPIETLHDVGRLAIPICATYFLLSGIKKSDDGEESSNRVNVEIILNLKSKALDMLTSYEKKIYLKTLSKKINSWYETDKDSHLFAALIMRMNDKAFVKILKDACNLESYNDNKSEGALKSILYEKPLEIMEDYSNKDVKMNVLNNTLDLFTTYFELDKSEPFRLMNFMSTHEKSCTHKSREEIIEEIDKTLEDNKPQESNDKIEMSIDEFNSLFFSTVKEK